LVLTGCVQLDVALGDAAVGPGLDQRREVEGAVAVDVLLVAELLAVGPAQHDPIVGVDVEVEQRANHPEIGAACGTKRTMSRKMKASCIHERC
jgi:hypothetical protein